VVLGVAAVSDTAAPPFASRQLPTWFDDAKFGIFIHWGPYAVPCFAPTEADMGDLIRAGDWQEIFRQSPYTEWYLNSLALEGSATNIRHPVVYGDRTYDSFVAEFVERSRGADLESWAELFAFAGARYVVPVTKHHDGFLMWPSATRNPHRFAWRSELDVIGTLLGHVRDRGMRAGVYYSGGLDWTFVPPPIDGLTAMFRSIPDSDEYIAYATGHVHELIARYTPDVLWNDIGWPARSDPNEIFSSYYERMPDGVVNDRFNMIAVAQGSLHADFTTPEYATTSYGSRKWEVCRGIGRSFGYNRAEPAATLLDPAELVHMLCDIVSRGGNLLLNVGPTADGHIPAAQAARLTALGWWLRQNGSSIFGTRPWLRPHGRTSDGQDVRFTAAADGSHISAIVLGTPPGRRCCLEGVRCVEGTEVTMLGNARCLPSATVGDALHIELPDHLAESPAVAFRISPSPTTV
jgi:alpha-L-fucosidase